MMTKAWNVNFNKDTPHVLNISISLGAIWNLNPSQKNIKKMVIYPCRGKHGPIKLFGYKSYKFIQKMKSPMKHHQSFNCDGR